MLACDHDLVARHSALLEKYRVAWDRLAGAYPTTWRVPFMAKHRFVNRVLLEMFVRARTPRTVLDFGCYDGMLVALLNASGIEAWGVERLSWPEMWKAIGVAHRINTAPTYCDVPASVGRPAIDDVVALNCLHEYHPEQALELIVSACGGTRPARVWADREARTPHRNNRYWMDNSLLSALGWKILKLPEYSSGGDADLQRDLLEWEAL
jgi:hypothetical protein